MLGRIVFAAGLLAASGVLVWRVFLAAGETLDATTVEATVKAPEPYQERAWEDKKTGNLNISVYLFRDDNRSGRYDKGDLPMASVLVNMEHPDGSTRRAVSNINGYANFKMALDNPDHPINVANEVYRFEVIEPPGWKVSSGNKVQDIRFIPLAGSVAGLVAETAPNWVGMMPQLRVTGRVVEEDGEPLPGDLQVQLLDTQGVSTEVEIFEGGKFSVPLVPGDWVLSASSAVMSWELERTFQALIAPVEMTDIIVGATPPQPLPVTGVENFDWLQRSVLDKIPNDHLGLNWDYLIAVNNQKYGGPGYVNGLTSGHAVAYNSSGHPVTISSAPGELFDFVGGYFTVAWERSQGEILDVIAWREGQQVGQHALKLSYLGPVWLDAEFRAIDKLTLTARHYWQFVADDLKFRNAAAE